MVMNEYAGTARRHDREGLERTGAQSGPEFFGNHIWIIRLTTGCGKVEIARQLFSGNPSA